MNSFRNHHKKNRFRSNGDRNFKKRNGDFQKFNSDYSTNVNFQIRLHLGDLSFNRYRKNEAVQKHPERTHSLLYFLAKKSVFVHV